MSMMPDFEKIFEKPRRSKPMLTDELRKLMNLAPGPQAPPMPSDMMPPQQRPMMNAVPYGLPEMPDFAAMQDDQKRQDLMRRNTDILRALLRGEPPMASARPAIMPGGMGPQDQVLPSATGGYDVVPAPEFGWNQNNPMNAIMRLLESQFPGGNWR